jgi:hypothetical protein
MGCCETKNTATTHIEERIKASIETGNLSGLKSLFLMAKHSNKQFDLNSLRYKIDDQLQVSPLGLSLLYGQPQVFSLILNELNGDFSLMEDQFAAANTTGLSIICLNNYFSMLQVYMPKFMLNKQNGLRRKPLVRGTLNLDDPSMVPEDQLNYTPIQLACESGHISIVNYFKAYVAGLELVPPELDVHFVEPETGNNCALIACKANNFSMIKFLHVQCKADFTLVNSYNENALNILAIGSSQFSNETFKCLEYLVEKVGVDFEHNYQETIVMLGHEESVVYLKTKLEEKGIEVNKRELEKQGDVVGMKRTIVRKYDTGNRFTFTRMFPELLKSSVVSVRGTNNLFMIEANENNRNALK